MRSTHHPPARSATAFWWFDSHDVHAAVMLRDEVCNLARASFPSLDAVTSRLIIDELLSNVVLHAAGPTQIRLELHDDRPQICVVDSGTGFVRPARVVDPETRSGRGLLLVEALATRLVIDRARGGGAEVTAGLPLTDEPTFSAEPEQRAS